MDNNGASGMRGWWRRRPRWLRLTVRIGLIAALIVTAEAGIPFAWTQLSAAGYVYDESDLTSPDMPAAEVVMVLGGQVEPDRITPRPFLRGRLDTTAAVLAAGRARVVLVSGDGGGASGDEIAAMTGYLASAGGVDRARVVGDPYGLDTYDSCLRAKQVFGIERMLVVTQSYHLSRTVALCRHVGIEAYGVAARCDGCLSLNLVRNWGRDYFACTKAALDALHDRPAAVASEPSPAVRDALARF